MAIGQRIRFFRNRKGMTQKYLGEFLGFVGKTSDVRMAQYESEAMFFASPFWTKLQNIFGQSCMSKLDKVAKHWPALNRPAKQALQTL